MLRVGRLAVVFQGEEAELPDWAVREYEWLIHRVPGVFPVGLETRTVAEPAREDASSPLAEDPAPPMPAPVVTADDPDADGTRRARGSRRPR